MTTILITGTNGKTSVSYFLEQLFLQNGISCARYATTGTFVNGIDQRLPNCFFGQEGVDELRSILTLDETVSVLIWEVFSSSLEAGIYDHWSGDICILTNLTEDHYELHGSMEKYHEVKFKLFKQLLKKDGVAIVHDSEKTKNLITYLKNNNTSVESVSSGTDFYQCISENTNSNFTQFKFDTTAFQVEGKAIFTTENLKFAILAYLKTGQTFQRKEYSLKLPTGRMISISRVDEADIIIDYAHNIDAFTQIVKYGKKTAKGKLILIFGCGGERDKIKRKQFGEIAQHMADIVIVTNDNPRRESPALIREQIIHFCTKAVNIANRIDAISYGIKKSRLNDLVLILGRGHETHQEIETSMNNIGTDEKIVRKILT